jgi:hypothetical protein
LFSYNRIKKGEREKKVTMMSRKDYISLKSTPRMCPSRFRKNVEEKERAKGFKDVWDVND